MPNSISKEHKALATTLFERFFSSGSFDDTLNYFSQITDVLGLRQGRINQFYPVLRQCILNNNAQSLFRLLDERRKNPIYQEGQVASSLTTLVVGCGPIGLRTAIEAQLMGARVVCLEKRKSATRNNVMHIWPFVIEDLKMLGVKVFFPKFCTGSMNHISIRRLQSVLLKVSLVLGIEVHVGVSYSGLEEPRDPNGAWRVRTTPLCPSVNSLDIDVLVGAEGVHVTVPGFPRQEFRGKLAIAITANFVNNNTTPEAIVEEISGIAFVYKQDFFNALYDELGIALENIVYYKDETHYFVMTTKKHSLLTRGVLIKDYKDPVELLKPSNVKQSALLDYIRDTCDYCTDYQLPNLKFALNHHGQPDVALFDFTSMFAAKNSIHVKERHSRQLLSCLVGDGLLEPFWPTGTGAARGFLGAYDACWAMKSWADGNKSVLQIIAEREAIFKMLAQTTPENIAKEGRRYTADPSTRYTHVNYRLMSAEKVLSLYDSDCPENGWNFPHVDNKKLDLARELDAKRQNLRRPSVSSDVAFDLNYLEQKTAEISRQMHALEPKRMKEGGGSAVDPRAGYNLRQRNAAAGSTTKPSIHDKKAAKPDNLVRRLTSEQMAVLQCPDDITKPSEQQQVGKLTADMMSVLMTGNSGEERRAATNPGKLSTDQLSVLADQEDRLEQERRQRQMERAVAAAKNISKLSLRPDEGLARERQQKQQQLAAAKQAGLIKKKSSFVDMELDDMLVQLEHDDDFQKLTDNEQMAWLESLFFLDTGSNPRRSLNKVNPNQKDHSLSINKSSNDPLPTTTPVPTKPSVVKAKAPRDKSSELQAAGVNNNLVSLAQSFFANEGKGNKGVKSKTTIPKTPLVKQSTTEARAAVATPVVKSAQKEEIATAKIPERAFFEPSSPGKKTFVKEESPEFPPPIPPRSSQTTKAMMRLMNTATNIMKQ